MREIELKATARSREAIEHYLFDGYETTSLGFGGSRYGAKAQPLDSNVVTPNGMRKMGSLKVGSPVSNPDGSISKVIGVFQQGIKPCFRVNFDDGASTRCSADHLWNVHIQCTSTDKQRFDGRWRVATTRQIADKIKAGKGVVIPLTFPVEFTHAKRVPLTITPYAVGLLLGDGCLRGKQVSFTTVDSELIAAVEIGTGVRFKETDKQNYASYNPSLISELKRLGIHGHLSGTKFVPPCYLLGNIEERKSLLQGLMDTDGTIDVRGHASYTSVSSQLAKDVQYLAWSLGYKCSISKQPASYVSQKTGERVYCQDAHKLEINGANMAELFKLERKKARCVPRREVTRRIISIESDGGCEMQCIAVDRPNSLYLTDDFIVTHNTWTGAQIMGYRRLMYENTRGLCLRTVQRAADLNLGEELKNAFFKRLGMPVGRRSGGGVAYLESEKRFVLPNGSLIQIAYCRLAGDWEQHLGLQWDDIWFEQAEQMKEEMYDKFLGSNRPNNPNCIPRMLTTFNPGGPGQDWLYRRIIDPVTRDRRTVYVKSTVRECLSTLERDPSYIPQKLMKIRDAVTRKRWLDGDWDVINGSFFVLPERTVREMYPPRWAEWHGAIDYGHGKPYCYLLTAFWQDDKGHPHLHVQDMVYRTRLDTDVQAQLALEMENEVRSYTKGVFKEVEYRLADPSTGTASPKESETQSKTIADQWRENGLYTYPAGKFSRPARWALLRRLLNRDILTISSRCQPLILEIKRAVQAEGKDDIDQAKCADHALDALAYIICTLLGLNYGASQQYVDGYGRPIELVGADERP